MVRDKVQTPSLVDIRDLPKMTAAVHGARRLFHSPLTLNLKTLTLPQFLNLVATDGLSLITKDSVDFSVPITRMFLGQSVKFTNQGKVSLNTFGLIVVT